MAKRRANGEGSIRKRKDGRWEGRYTAGRDLVTGKAIYKNVLGKTQAEVKEKLKSAIEKNSALPLAAGQYTLGQWLDIWMENYAKLQVRASSYKTYQGFASNHIKPNLGDLPLEKLTAMDLQRLYKHLLESGRVECTESRNKPKGLSVKTVRNINQMISSALNCAVEQRLIPANPTKGCVLPKLERKEMKIPSPEDLSTFFEEARCSGVFELYYIDLATGLRRGELLGLQDGVDVRTLSAMLGHYSAGFAPDTYAHVTTSMQMQAANAVGNFLPGPNRSALWYGSRLGLDQCRKIKLPEKAQKAKTKPRKFNEFSWLCLF